MRRLVVSDVHKVFGGVQVLDGVDFEVGEGEIVGLVGGNGAGKTTLLNALFGVPAADRGSIRLGERALGRSPAEAIAAGMARTLQNVTFSLDQTVRSAVEAAALGRRLREGGQPPGPASACVAALLDAFGLAAHADASAGELPFGLQRRLDVARAFASGASLVCLDEPAAGLGEAESADLADALRARARRDGVALLVVDHRVEFLRRVVDRVIFLEGGRVAAAGPLDAVLADARVRASWLGGGPEGTARCLRSAQPVRMEATGVTVRRGGRIVVHPVDLALRAGAWTSINGHNGAGKTSLVEALAGLLPCAAGRVRLTEGVADPAARTDVLLVSEGRDIFPALTVAENLRLGLTRSVSAREWAETLRAVCDRWPPLARALHGPAARLSGGERHLAAIARAWVRRAAVLLIDEVTAGLAPVWIERVADTLSTMVGDGVSLVTTDQVLVPAVRARSDAWTMQDGRLRRGAAAGH